MAIPSGPSDARLRYCHTDEAAGLSALTAQTSTPSIAKSRLRDEIRSGR